MMTESQRDNISKFVDMVAKRSPTESLIAFVAANSGMLLVCQRVLDLLKNPGSVERRWLQEQCHNSHIETRLLQSESERIISIFQPGFESGDEYRLLGLNPGATTAEVKSAFHKLSFRYHPDSSTTNDSENSQKFIAICRAYKKITRVYDTQGQPLNDSESAPWRQAVYTTRKRSKQDRKTIFLLAAVAVGLLLISLAAAFSYRKNAMLKSLESMHKIEVADDVGKIDPAPAQIAAVVINKSPAVVPPVPEVTTPQEPESAVSPLPKPVQVAAVISAPEQPQAVVAAVPVAKKKKREPVTPVPPAKPKLKPVVTPVQSAEPERVSISCPVSVRTKPETKKIIRPTPKATIEIDQQPVVLPPPVSPPVKKVINEPQPVVTPEPPARPIKAVTNVTSQPKKVVPDLSSVVTPSLTAAVSEKSVPAPPLRSRIERFLTSYTNAYELLDLDIFAAFFVEDARENNTPFKEKSSQYHKLFAKLKEVSYEIRPQSWSSHDNLVYISGNFHAYFLYRNGEELNVHGTTDLILQEDQGRHFKVKNLAYTLE